MHLVGTVETVRTALNSRVAQVGRSVSAVVFCAIAFSAVTVQQADATSGNLPCAAAVMQLQHPYNVVTISVLTRPGASVTATEKAGTNSWPMSPNSTANTFGRARLSQKMASVRDDAIVRVSVNVTLNGSSGHCSTFYRPPSLVPQN